MSGRRNVFHSETVDLVTGEVISLRRDWVSNNSEMFGMYRTTAGLEWVIPFGEKELKLMMLMQEYSDPNTAFIALSNNRRKDICSFLGFSTTRSLTSVLGKLIAKDGIVRAVGSNNDFMVNPLCFFKGSSKDLKARIEKYNNLKQK
jgi:hypothetical protein